MNPIRACLFALILALLCACNNDEEGQVMRSDSPLRLYLAKVDSHVEATDEKLPEMERFDLDSVDDGTISTEYPYWQGLYMYVDEIGIQKASLYSEYEKGLRTEDMYFRGGELVYGLVDQEGLLGGDGSNGKEYYFADEKLIFALEASGETMDIEQDTVKMKAIDLVKEAAQIRELLAKKDVKP